MKPNYERKREGTKAAKKIFASTFVSTPKWGAGSEDHKPINPRIIAHNVSGSSFSRYSNYLWFIVRSACPIVLPVRAICQKTSIVVVVRKLKQFIYT
jgi:hypothetical protein